MRAASRLAVLAMLVAALAAPAGASEVSAGFDLFESQPGTTADLTSLHPSCPAAVPLEGVPLVPASLGNTDTIVERFAGSGSPFDPPAAMVTVPIELVALHLVSATPVDLSCAGGPAAVDLHLTVNKGGIIAGLPQPDVLMPSIGSMEIRHDLGPGALDDFGGTFDSCFGAPAESGHPACATLGVPMGGVYANAIFTVPGGDPSEPADVVSSAPADRVALSSTGGTWLHIPAPGYPLDPAFPAGAFFVQTLPHIGPHPVEPAKVVEATKVDSLTSVGGASGDTDADGVADPGETVSYTVEITGLGDAADVTLDDTIDANSTLVGGSVQITPIAFDDFYELTAAMLTVPAATGVLLNDVDPDHSTMPGTNAGLTAVSLDVMGTSGTVSNFMPDGSFEYEPAMGFSGLDSFQYTARDEDSLDSVVTGVVVIDVKNTPPTATDDSYDSLGNTLLEVTLDHAGVASTDNTVVTQPSVIGDTSPAKTYRSVFENDTDTEDTDKNDLTAAVVGGTVTAGAIVTMFDDGTFEYTPPIGFTGADTFDYTVTDTGGLMDTGTVTINVSGKIWYVDKDNAGTADGRSATPFTSLAPLDAGGAADASDGNGDTIFVFDESTGNTSGGILLEANQILHGNGVALDPAGFEYAGGGDLVAAATAPTIEDAAGDVVELANGNTVRGLDIAATAGRAIFGNNTAGATITDVATTGGTGVRFDNATGTLNVTDLDVNSSTGAGIDIQGGSATFTFDSLSSVTSPSGAGINISGGTASLTFPGNITQANNFPALNVVNHSTGTVGLGGTNTVTNGTGLQFSNADGTYNVNSMSGTTSLMGGDAGIDILGGSSGTFTFGSVSITDPSGVAFNMDTSPGGNTTFGGTITQNNAASAVRINAKTAGSVAFNGNVKANTSTEPGINLTGNASGTIRFNKDLDIDTTSGTGFNATGGGTVHVPSSSASTTVDTTTGIGVNIGATIGANSVVFDSVNVNGATQGILLANTGTGTFTVTGGTIQNVTNRGFDAANVDGTVSIGADIQNDGGRSVEITGSEGQFTFDGLVNEDAQGINVSSNNTGSPTFTFRGGVDVDTIGANTGFNAFSGGTLNVCADTNCNGTGTALVNTIDTTAGSGSAIVVDLVTIGAAGLTFRSIDVNGATTGIVLDSTGTTGGGFTVTGINGPCGDTALAKDCDGGVIQNVTTGVSLTQTSDVALNFMRFRDVAGEAIVGDRVSDGTDAGDDSLEVRSCEFLDVGTDSANHDVMDFHAAQSTAGTFNISGNLVVADSLFDQDAGGANNAFEKEAIYVRNHTGNLVIDILSSRFQNNAGTAGTALNVSAFGNNTVTVNYSDSQAIDIRGEALFGTAKSPSASLDVNFVRNEVRSTGTHGAQPGISIGAENGGSLTFDIADNNAAGCASCGFFVPNVAIIVSNQNDDGQPQASTMEGRIQRNLIDMPDLGGGLFGDAVRIFGDANEQPDPATSPLRTVVLFEDNTILDGDEGMEVSFRQVNAAATPDEELHLTVRGNTFGTMANPISDIGVQGTEFFNGGPSVFLLFDNNTFYTVDESLDIRSRDDATVNLTVINHTNITSTTDDELEFDTANAATGCLDMRNNTLQAGSRAIELEEDAGTTLEVVQKAASAAADPAELDDLNGVSNTLVDVSGAIGYQNVASCTLPTLPSNP